MQTLNQKIQVFLKNHKYRRIHALIFLVLALFIAATIVSSLTKPAVSMSGDLICGLEEHTHTDECYGSVLICGKAESSGHVHNEDCYKKEHILVCGKENNETHAHNEECYKNEYVLICDIPEQEVHNHTKDCYEKRLICTLPEHKHSKQCFETVMVDNYDTADQEFASINANLNFRETFSNGIKYMSDSSGMDFITGSSVNFGVHVSQISYKDTLGESTDTLKSVKLTINYTLPENTLMQQNDNKQIHCKLSDNVIIPTEKTGPVMKNGSQIGNYTITTDGYIIIDFNSDFVKNGKSEITGDITFNAQIKKSDTSGEKETITVDGGNVSTDVDFSQTVKNDLAVEKSSTGYDSNTKTIGYKVDIYSVHGSGSENITLIDELTGNNSLIHLNLESGSVVLHKTNADGSTEDVTANLTMSEDGKATFTDIPPLNAEEKYTLEYSATLTPGDTAKIIDTGNKAIISSGSLNDKSDYQGRIATGCVISGKSGNYNDRTDNITWDIKVMNPNFGSIGGYKIQDNMLSNAIGGVTVKDSQGNIVTDAGTLDDTNTFTFNNISGSEYYTIQYQTKTPAHNQNVSNTAVLYDPEDNEVNRETGSAWVSNALDKSGCLKGYDANNNALINWNVSIRTPEGEIDQNVYKDTMSKEPENYMTPEQAKGIVISYTDYYEGWATKVLARGTDYTVQYFDKDNNSVDIDTAADDVKIFSFEVSFINNNDTTDISSMNITYTSTGSLDASPDENGAIKYTNTADFRGESKTAEYTETKKPSLVKLDAADPNNMRSDDTIYDAGLILDEGSGNYILKWCIRANESNNYGANNAVITDTLPGGVSLIESSVKFKKFNGSYMEDATGLTYTQSQNDDGKNQIVFNVPYSVHNGQKFEIYYNVSVTEEYAKAHKNGIYSEFRNTASDGLTDISQMQKIKLSRIKKTASDPATSYDGYVDYSIDVNPDAEKLSPNGIITITDKMQHYPDLNPDGSFKYNWGFTATLIKLDVYKIKTDASGNETLVPLNPSEYKMSLTDQTDYSCSYKITQLELPDETHLKIDYKYHLTVNDENYANESAKNNQGKYNQDAINSVELDYGIGTETDNERKTYDLFNESGAHAVTSDYLKIYKIDSDNYALKLDGAEFNLYRWDNSKWIPLTASNNTSGKIEAVWGSETDSPFNMSTGEGDNASGEYLLPELESEYIYKLVEVKPPNDYIKRVSPYYFVLNSIPPVTLPENLDASDILVMLKGGIINCNNTELKKANLTVNKYWNGSKKQDVEVELIKSTIAPQIEGGLSEPTESSQANYINVTIKNNSGYELKKKFAVSGNEEATLKFDSINSTFFGWKQPVYVDGNQIDIWRLNGTGIKSVTEENEGKKVTITFEPLTKSYDLVIDYTDQYSDGFSYSITPMTSNCSEVQSIPDATEPSTGDDEPTEPVVKIPEISDKTVVINKVTLGDSNSWSHTWEQLPATDEEGNPYYYYVREVTEISGYTVKYDTNGIRLNDNDTEKGAVNITNKESGYVNILPVTGGLGTKLIIVFGLVIMLIPVSHYYLFKRHKQRKVR